MGVDGWESFLIASIPREYLDDWKWYNKNLDSPRLYARYYVLHDFWGNYNEKKYFLKEYVMKGKFGKHVLSVDNTDRARLKVHWEGFCRNNDVDPIELPKRLPRKKFFKKYRGDRF